MLRLVWIVLALAVSAFVGSQWYVNAPLAAAWLNSFAFGAASASQAGEVPALALTGAAVVATTAAFLLVFGVLAAADFVKHQSVIGHLARLKQAHGAESVSDLSLFLRAFRDDDELARLASDYGATLHAEQLDPGGRPNARTRYRATAPAVAYFNKEALVDRALFAPVFQYFPGALIGIGLAGLSLAIASAAAAGLAGPGSEPSPVAARALLEGARAGFTGLVLSVLAAVLTGLAFRIAVAARHHQVGRLCQEVDTLFRGPGAVDYLREMVRGQHGGTAQLTATMRAGTSDLSTKLDHGAGRVAAALADAAETTSGTISDAVKGALSKPMSKIAEVSRRQAKDQSAHLDKVLKATLPAFVAELEQHFGNQVKDINAVLQSSAAIVTGLEGAFADVSDKLSRRAAEQVDSLSDAFRTSLEAAGERDAESRNSIASDLRRLSESLGEGVESHSRQFEALLNNMLDRVEYLTESAVATSAADLAQTAESFAALRTVVESLVVSVTPVLNQVADTQERLIKALEDEGAAGKIIARSAGDMGAAARASRETVERFIVLAESLSETRSALGAEKAGRRHLAAAPPAAAGSPSAAADPHPAEDGLGRAIRDLRRATEDSAKKLPKL